MLCYAMQCCACGVALLMDLGLKGSSLASCLAELESTVIPVPDGGTDTQGVEFSALLILYSRHAGLRAPSNYNPDQSLAGGQEDKDKDKDKDKEQAAVWVPTTTGMWAEVSECETRAFLPSFLPPCLPASLPPCLPSSPPYQQACSTLLRALQTCHIYLLSSPHWLICTSCCPPSPAALIPSDVI